MIYSDIFERLEREAVRYVVVSGVAVVLHGYVRPVADLDIVIDPATNEADRALHSLLRAGFVPTLPLPLSTLTMMRLFDQTQREIDVFVRYRIPFNTLWESSECMRVGSSLARVMPLDQLLQDRRISGRPHDLLDIEGLLALEGHRPNLSSTPTPSDTPPPENSTRPDDPQPG
jgi:hypothetical protein